MAQLPEEVLSEADEAEGFGLFSVRERLHFVGGAWRSTRHQAKGSACSCGSPGLVSNPWLVH